MDGRYGPAKEQRKTIHEEKLPGLLFILTGSLIFVIGVVKLLTCWWHQYFYALWTGLLVSSLLNLNFWNTISTPFRIC